MGSALFVKWPLHGTRICKVWNKQYVISNAGAQLSIYARRGLHITVIKMRATLHNSDKDSAVVR